jgi:hypothetical protein
LIAFEQPLRARREKRKARARKEDKAKTRWEKLERDKMPVSGGVGREDTEFALALARSTVEDVYLGTSPSSSTSNPLAVVSPSTSPSAASTWAHPQPRSSFAHALHSRTTTSQPLNRQSEADWEVEAAWAGFESLSVRGPRGEVNMDDDGEEERGTIRETERGGGGGARKPKKGAKKKLVLGGGGGRRA